jgi:hypothetical protein
MGEENMLSLTTITAVLKPFAAAASRAQSTGQAYGGDTTGYGVGVRVVSSSPFLDGWRVVADPTWPLNWNAHLVLPDGSVMPTPDGVRHDVTADA